jgi:hypothetical protein
MSKAVVVAARAAAKRRPSGISRGVDPRERIRALRREK